MSKLGAAQNSFQPASIRLLNSLKPFPPNFLCTRPWLKISSTPFFLAFAISSTFIIHFKESVSTCSIYRRSFIMISPFPFFFFFPGFSGRLLLCFWRRSRVKGEQAKLNSRGFARSLRVAVHLQEDLPWAQESRKLRRLPSPPLFSLFLLYSDDRKLQQIC